MFGAFAEKATPFSSSDRFREGLAVLGILTIVCMYIYIYRERNKIMRVRVIST